MKAAGNTKGKWRRRWKRVPPERRPAAATALADVFARRRGRGGGVVLFLLLSLALHLPAALLVRTDEGADLEALAGEQTYLRKVLQKERAQTVSREMHVQQTMPPPPPDPQAVVSETLATDISTDIQRVLGDMLDLTVTKKLAATVTSDLRAELAEAAKSIAAGQLSQEEIRRLQEQFKQKAHRKAVTALRVHREKTQVSHAKKSVKQWYEQRVSAPLTAEMRKHLRGGDWGHIWWHQFGGWWGFLHSRYAGVTRLLGGLAGGMHQPSHSGISGRPTGNNNMAYLPDWPKPSAAQARALEHVLRTTIYERHPKGYTAAWGDNLDAQLDCFCPHRRREMEEQVVAKMKPLWEQVFRQVGTYRDKAEAGAPAAELAAAQQACFQTLKALHGLAGRLLVGHEEMAWTRAVNQAVRSRVLRGPATETAYRRYVDAMVAGLTPAIRDVAAGEFAEGIIIRRQGIDGTVEAFAGEVLALLRRDVQRVLPKAEFDRIVFESYNRNPYRSKVTGKSSPPDADDIRRDEAALTKALAAWGVRGSGYVEKRAEVIAAELDKAIDRVTGELLGRITEEGRLARRFYAAAESVDYTDRVAQRLSARARGLAGRGQDLAELTDEGVPDASAAMVAMMFGAARGQGASLEPVPALMVPGHVSTCLPARALRSAPPRLPAPPRSWARLTQPVVSPDFDSPCYEAIPFLANFPRLDGDLTDWGRIRPLVLQKARRGSPGPAEPILLYAAWNYQGFFFGYRVDQPAVQFAYQDSHWYSYCYREVTGVPPETAPTGWAYSGDYLRLLFDTLDARGEWRGEPHTQEFGIFPRGTDKHPNIPGFERIIRSTRDAHPRGSWGGQAVDRIRIFPPQPGPQFGPDGTGPYRVTRFAAEGYSVEIFLPRSLCRVPVFCPGWWIGFDCVVAMGRQSRALHGQIWVPRWERVGHMRKERPSQWGDLLLLGTDPYLTVQQTDAAGSLAQGIVPGHSYLLTVVDPDRNIHLSGRDIIVVSAEVLAGNGSKPARAGDAEVFVLKETGKNTSVFRGYVNTAPGVGRQVQGVLEVLPGAEVRFGYVDLADAHGRRNVVYTVDLPAVAGLTVPLAGGP